MTRGGMRGGLWLRISHVKSEAATLRRAVRAILRDKRDFWPIFSQLFGVCATFFAIHRSTARAFVVHVRHVPHPCGPEGAHRVST